MHPNLIKNLAGLLHDQQIANTTLVRCWKTNAHWQTSDSLARKSSEAKMMGIVLVNYMRCAATSIGKYEVEHVCICPGFSGLPGQWYLCVVMALVHMSRISFTSACIFVYMCGYILGCPRKTLFQKNKKRNPPRISLRVSLNRSKRIFDFDQV